VVERDRVLPRGDGWHSPTKSSFASCFSTSAIS
jgi:hypothetical protein